MNHNINNNSQNNMNNSNNFINNNIQNNINNNNTYNNNMNSNINNNFQNNRNDNDNSFTLFNNNINQENSHFSQNSSVNINISSSNINSYMNDSSLIMNDLTKEIINQSKKLYIEYLKNVTHLEREITKDDFENLFLKKINVNYNNKQYTLNEAIEELSSQEKNKDFNQIFEEIIRILKQQVCLYCYCDINNDEFKLPCGCVFCCSEHLDSFFKEKILNKLKYNYKCFCSYEYKANKVMELCNFLKNKNVYKDYNSLISLLNELFRGICFKCGCEKKDMSPVDIEGFFPLKFNHFICEDCVENDSSNYVKCSICSIQHKYLLNDF
jgi:hypothetical protein